MRKEKKSANSQHLCSWKGGNYLMTLCVSISCPVQNLERTVPLLYVFPIYFQLFLHIDYFIAPLTSLTLLTSQPPVCSSFLLTKFTLPKLYGIFSNVTLLQTAWNNREVTIWSTLFKTSLHNRSTPTPGIMSFLQLPSKEAFNTSYGSTPCIYITFILYIII